MIDYVIVRRRDLQDLHQVRAMRGAECWTEHHPVRAKMELKIRPKARLTTTPRAKKIEVSKFSHFPETKNIFQNALTSIELNGTNSWEDFKVKVLSAAQDTLGFRKTKCQDWFAENYEEIDAFLETKRNLFRKTLSTNLSNQAKMEATKNIQGFSKSGKIAYMRNTKPVVPQEGKRSTTCSKQQKLEIVLPNNQRALCAATINFCSHEIKIWCHLETTRRYQKGVGVNIIANSLIAIQSLTNQYWISLSNMVQS